VLACVGESDGLSQADIVEETGVDRSTIAELVRRMGKKGLLQRRRSKQDARAYIVKLTESGRETLKSAN
jgi:MarR family transcriptional regulator, temperature-dependent positive regulator of motility